MTISKKDAAEALYEIDRTTGRSQTLRRYAIAGPVLMLWGALWAAGYVAMGLTPIERWGLIWLVLDLLGVAASVLILRRGWSAQAGAAPGTGWRMVVGGLVAGGFVAVLLMVFWPVPVSACLVIPGLVCGFIYIAVGLMRLPRFAWIGVAMLAASLVGYWLLQPWLTFWMAGVGAVGLGLGGLWLRRA